MNTHMDWKLILRYLSGSLTRKNKERIDAWLALDVENQKLLDLLQEVWDSPEVSYAAADAEAAWKALTRKAGLSITLEKRPTKIVHIPKPKAARVPFFQRIPVHQAWRYAAIILLAVCLPYLYNQLRSVPSLEVKTAEMQEVTVEHGKHGKLTLADGTQITLDAGSKFSYPLQFTDDTREVYVSGEGYFKVAHNPQKPFIVHANGAVVRVLGTAFNVRAWRQNQQVKVAVAEGRVSLRSENLSEEAAVVIAKGRMGILDKEKLTMPVRVDIDNQLAWLKYEMVFENTPLSEVLHQLKRWYELEFQLPSPVYNSVKISGTIKKKPIDDILEAIALMINLRFQRRDNLVVFYQKG